MARQIDLDQLMKYPLRRGSEHCDEKNADPRFLNGVESVLEWAQTLPTLTPQNDPLTIEELREMDGEPVYIISEFYHISEWNIPNGIGEIVIAYDVPCAGMKEVIPSIKFIDGKELAVEKYGSSWVAYENKDGAVPQKGEFEWIEETY